MKKRFDEETRTAECFELELVQPTASILSAITRFRCYFRYFVSVADAEAECSRKTISDWVHNLGMLRDAFTVVTAVRTYAWSENARLARPLERLCDSFESHYGRIHCRLRSAQVTEKEAPRFIQFHLVRPLVQYGPILDAAINRFATELKDPSPPFDSDVVISAYWQSELGKHAWVPAFDQSMTWEIAELDLAAHDRNDSSICRMLRRTRLVHFAWGTVEPQRWDRARDESLMTLHQESIRNVTERYQTSIQEGIASLTKLNRQSFVDAGNPDTKWLKEVS